MSEQASSALPPLPVTPDEATWRAMSEDERLGFIVRCMEYFEEETLLMGEGRPHSSAKARVMDLLRRHYQRTNRLIYVAPELMVLYPGEAPVNPDIMAVLGVADPGEDDQRLCWSVVDEGKGVDLVLEVLHRGDARKDLVHNVERYARLGIREYFVYDRRSERVVGWRLAPEGTGYGALAARAGRLYSEVLDLDLAVIDSRLRFFQGAGELVDSDSLIAALSKMVDDNVSSFEAEQAARERAEQERDGALQERDGALEALRAAVRTILRGRGFTWSSAVDERIDGARGALLERWLRQALTADTLEQALDESSQ